jgi:hypothetical protein
MTDLGDQRSKDVDGGQEDIGERLQVAERAAAECPKEVLHCVGQFRHAAVTDHGGGALESVGGPEDLVHHSRIQAALETEQAPLDLADLLERLVCEETVVARL